MNSDKLIDIFFTADNPIFFALLFTVIIIIVFYLINKYVRLPDLQKHKIKLDNAELKSARVMAMFAELDPDPLIRVDINGKIVKTNDSAKRLFADSNSKDITGILPEIKFSVEEFINEDRTGNFTQRIGTEIYSISFKGISYLKIGQFYFNNLTERVNFEEKLKQSQNRLKQMMVHQQNLIEEERKRLARELHDGIGQNLVVMKMSASNALENVKDKIDIEYHQKQIIALDNTINELKSILHNLKPKVLEEFGLEAAIRTMSNNIIEEFKINGHVNFIGFKNRLDQNFELTIFRIIQEALNNIVKHSKAKEYDVNLISENGKIRILISDDGIGFDCDDDIMELKGFGLRGMKERIENYSGTINIESSSETGTWLIVELPKKELRV